MRFRVSTINAIQRKANMENQSLSKTLKTILILELRSNGL